MEAKAEEREFIVEKGKNKNNISKRTVYSGTLFIYITKKKKLQILIIYTNTPAFKNKSLI